MITTMKGVNIHCFNLYSFCSSWVLRWNDRTLFQFHNIRKIVKRFPISIPKIKGTQVRTKIITHDKGYENGIDHIWKL